jgi:transcriptional regulator with XRE-family HTH domain
MTHGVDASAIAKIERGPTPNPTVGTLTRVAAAVGARITIGVEAADMAPDSIKSPAP